MKLFDVIEELVEERGLDRATLETIVCDGMLAAYQKKFPDLAFKAEVSPETGDLVVFVQKTIVSSVEDEYSQITLKKARNIDKDAALDGTIWVLFDGKIGRIEVLRARQIIAGNIRRVEATAVYNEFKDKQGEIVIGVIHKCERNGISVKLGDTIAFLPHTLSVPGDKCIVGYTTRALLKEVLQEPRNDNQLILDRSSPEFLQQLFELEIPEVFEKLVEIKKIVRTPGYKSKVAVCSHDRNIDPVGTCVGVGGGRIKPILKELGSEKIDIFAWSESLELLIKNALKPAKIDRVELSNDNKTAYVTLDEDQRSLAIGKGGQNIALASRLTGVSIQLVKREGASTDAETKQMSDEDGFEQEEI